MDDSLDSLFSVLLLFLPNELDGPRKLFSLSREAISSGTSRIKVGYQATCILQVFGLVYRYQKMITMM
jgi:hypothetical protein